MKRSFIFLLIPALLVSLLHIHPPEDTNEEGECPICLLVQTGAVQEPIEEYINSNLIESPMPFPFTSIDIPHIASGNAHQERAPPMAS